MSDFATQTKKPTAKEYLEVPLDKVVERLNNNPNGHKSEEGFVQAVLMVRAAKINERLSRRLNCLTGLLVVATICLVAVPFVAPPLAQSQLNEKLEVQARLIKTQKDEIEQLQSSISELTRKQGEIANEIQVHNEALQLTAPSAGALWVPSAAFGRSGGN